MFKSTFDLSDFYIMRCEISEGGYKLEKFLIKWKIVYK